MSGAALIFVWVATIAAQGGGTMELTTTAFKEGAPIPKKHTCDGQDTSPPMQWSGAPQGTQSFVLIADDPDAPVGTWVHWVVYNLPPGTEQLPEGMPRERELESGGLQGTNDFKRIGYGGPCPPPGKPHRYFFKLYALDGKLDLKAGATKREVEQAMQGHVLAEAQRMGAYGR